MKNKGFLLVIALLIIGSVGLIIYSNNKPNKSANNQSNAAEITAEDHFRGPADSPVVLIEYGDFQCPACKQFDPVMESLFLEYGDRVKFVYRHFPLTRIHPNAMFGHRAAEAAGRQGKFFEMGHMLYEQQDLWVKSDNPTAVLEAFAKQLGLDVDKFKSDFADPAVLEKINAQAKTGEAFNITGTPTFILNGQKIDTPTSFEAFRQMLEDALNRAKTSNT